MSEQTGSASEPQKGKKKKIFNLILKIASYVLVGLSFIFIIKTFLKIDVEQLKNINLYSIPILIGFILIYPVTIFIFSFAWKKFLELLAERKFDFLYIANLYLKANIAKYIPGNVFHFAGRHYLISKDGVSQQKLLLTNGFEIGSLLFSSASIILTGFITGIINPLDILQSEYFKQHFNTIITILIIIASLGVLLLIGLCVYFLFIKKVKIKKYIKFNTILVFIHNFICYCLIFLIIGTILYFACYFTLNLNFSFNNYLYVIFTFSLAWVLGFVVPGAPGGAGIREVVLIFMLNPVFGQTGALLATIILRIITISGDITGFLISLILSAILKKEKS